MRQLAVRNIGREQPTLLITNDLESTSKHLFARYAERMTIENELDAYIQGFHLDALTSGLPLNIDLDTTHDAITVDIRVRTYHPVLIDAGLADQTTPIPWLDGRKLRLRFPPR